MADNPKRASRSRALNELARRRRNARATPPEQNAAPVTEPVTGHMEEDGDGSARWVSYPDEPVTEPSDETCHCGQLVFVHGDGLRERGLCEHCDSVRCDAYPGACAPPINLGFMSFSPELQAELVELATEVTEPSDEAALAVIICDGMSRPGGYDTSSEWVQSCSREAARAVLASPWLAADRQRVAREAVSEALALGPAEQLALAVGSAQVERGEAPMDNIAIACVLTLMRLAAARERAGRD